MAIEVIEESDGSLTISWDENDPNESILNDWSSEDFTNLIKKGLEDIINKDNQSN